MTTKVLFIGGGRRVTLAERFIAKGCMVYAYELDERVPISSVATVIRGKAWKAQDFASHLQGVIEVCDIDLVVPLDDEAVAKVASMELSCRKLCSPADAAMSCWDKSVFAHRCPIELYPSPVALSPAILKPQFGFGSRDIREMAWYRDEHMPEGFIAQRTLVAPEYSVDAYFNLNGELVGASPRERIRVAGGEVMDSVTAEKPELVDAVLRLGNRFGFRGPICAQFMRDAVTGKFFCTEVNCRFGGGCTLSIAAGLDMVGYAMWEYAWVREAVPANNGHASSGVKMLRSFRDVYFPEAA